MVINSFNKIGLLVQDILGTSLCAGRVVTLRDLDKHN